MRSALACTLLLLLSGTSAAMPTMTRQHKHTATIDVPEGWTLLVQSDTNNVTMSNGLTTTVTLYWYPWAPGITLDEMLDILVDTVNQTLPIGEAREVSREDTPGFEAPGGLLRGKRADAEVKALGYTMKLGMVTLIDEPNQRVTAAFLVSPPDTFAELDGLETLTRVVGSLRFDEDPPWPHPGWWWNTAPPEALTASADE